MQDDGKISDLVSLSNDLGSGLRWAAKQTGSFLWSAASTVKSAIFGREKPQDTLQNRGKVKNPSAVISTRGVSFFQPCGKKALLAALACSIPVAAADVTISGFACTLRANDIPVIGFGVYSTYSTGNASLILMNAGYQCWNSNVTTSTNVFFDQAGLLSGITSALARTGYDIANNLLCTWTNGIHLATQTGNTLFEATALVTSSLNTGCLKNVANTTSTALLSAAEDVFKPWETSIGFWSVLGYSVLAVSAMGVVVGGAYAAIRCINCPTHVRQSDGSRRQLLEP